MDSHGVLLSSKKKGGETDSLLLTNVSPENGKSPREVYDLSIIYCYREANRPMDKLASFSHPSPLPP